MHDNPVNQVQDENNKPIKQEEFESDTQKIIHRHLENENDVITEDDIRNVRIGMVSSKLDEATKARFEESDEIEKIEDIITEMPQNDDEAPNSGSSTENPITTWDINK